MNIRNFLVALMMVGLAGCAMDSQEKEKKESLPVPQLPGAQTSLDQIPQNNEAAVKPPDLKNADDLALRALLTDLTPYDLVLNNGPIVDRIELHVIDAERFGTASPIMIDQAKTSRYIVRIKVSPQTPKLIIDRFDTLTNEKLSREYPLNIVRTAGPKEIIYESNELPQEKIVEYGEEGAVDHISIDSDGDLQTTSTYKKEPLFKKVMKSAPKYFVKFHPKSGRWEAQFEDLRFSLLRQERPEETKIGSEKTERQIIEEKYGVSFSDMRNSLFSAPLSSAVVRTGLQEQGISDLSAQNIYAIRNYISIYGSIEVPEMINKK